MSGFIPWEGRGRLRGKESEGGEARGDPMGVKEKPHTHIITHLNGTIVVRKPHNCRFWRRRLA